MDRRIFICYSKYGGESIAEHVYDFFKKRLEYEHVFFAKKEIDAGDNWKEKRDEALEKCNIFLFIVTSDVLTSKEVRYEGRKANELDKTIMPYKDADIDNWSQIEKEFELDSIQYVEFVDKEHLVRKLHKRFAVILQQHPKQEVAVEPIGLGLRVKFYQCEFRFKPPDSGGGSESLLTKEQFMEKTNQWIESLRAKAKIEHKSDNKSSDYLLTFPEGEVTISFGGISSAPQKEQEWYTRLIVNTDKLEMIDRMVEEVDWPYWVYRIVLIDKLDLGYLQFQIEEKSGQEITGSSESFIKDTSTGRNISMGRLIEYPFGRLKDDAKIKAQLSSGENADSVIQIWFISGGEDVGFYQAHTLLSPDKILSILLGDIARSEVQQIIKDACSKPSN